MAEMRFLELKSKKLKDLKDEEIPELLEYWYDSFKGGAKEFRHNAIATLIYEKSKRENKEAVEKSLEYSKHSLKISKTAMRIALISLFIAIFSLVFSFFDFVGGIDWQNKQIEVLNKIEQGIEANQN